MRCGLKIRAPFLEREIELVIAVVTPCIVATLAEAAGKLAGGAVNGNNFFRFYEFCGLQEIGEIGVVGERDRGMGAVAKPG